MEDLHIFQTVWLNGKRAWIASIGPSVVLVAGDGQIHNVDPQRIGRWSNYRGDLEVR
jgi:hypothetical protein